MYRTGNFPSRRKKTIISAMNELHSRVARRMRWLIFNLRWLLLAAAAFLAFVNIGAASPSGAVITLVGVAILYNIGLTLLEFFEYWEPWLTWLMFVADSILALGLFGLSGDSGGPLIWIGLLPATAIALQMSWPLALTSMAVFTLAQAALLLYLHPNSYSSLVPLAIAAAILWPLVVGGSVVAVRLRAFIAAVVQKDIHTRNWLMDSLRAYARAIYEMSSMVSATLDYNRVLDATLNYGAMGVNRGQEGDSGMAGAVLTFHEDQLRVTSAWGLPPADHRVLCPAREGVLADVIRTAESRVIADPFQDPELSQFIGFSKCHSLMVFPLRAGFETYGVVLYGHPQPESFTDDVRAFLTAVVNQAVIALQNAQLYRHLREEKERLVEVQEEAQKKLARDLHDGPTQSVAALAMRANFTRRLLDRDVKAAADELYKMEDLARRTTKEIRHMLFTLRPLVLESQGLTAALQQLAEKMRETHGQNVIVEAEPGVDEKLEKNQQGVLFYLTEEAVGNARKHAQAQHIWVRLKTQRDVLALEVQDDGVGFNVGAVNANYEKRGSLGMVNMRERAEILEGAVKIDSEEGKGTRITVLVPLTEAAALRVRS